MTATRARVELHWIPLGSGACVVRTSGRVYEALAALIGRRPRQALFHSALTVRDPDETVVIEMTPIPDGHGQQRGVVAEGAVGARFLGRSRRFRYEVRRWRGGVIPDLDHASSTVTIDVDVAHARRVLAAAACVPTPVWGRDELHAGEMWNSNSVTAWVLRRSGMTLEGIEPPAGGRAPGWAAGLVEADRRSRQATIPAR